MMHDHYQKIIENLSRLLNERHAAYPKRDRSYLLLCEALNEFVEYLRGNIDFSEFYADPEIVAKAEELSQKPIFICGPMKSGTSLLVQLLDSHPDLLVMPGDSHYINNKKKFNRSQFEEISTFWMRRLVNPTGKKPHWFIGPEMEDFHNFLQYLYFFLNYEQKDVFVCVVMAVFAYIYLKQGKIPKKCWVEKTPHNELVVEELLSCFPDAKFIHILRDPLENIASLKRMSEIRKEKVTSFEYANMIKMLFRAAWQNQKNLQKDKYFLIKYEDLVADPRCSMNSICSFLDIDFHEILLFPTENGRAGISNSMYLESMVEGKILDQSKRKKYRELLGQDELSDIVSILFQDALRAGYNWNDPEIACYRRSVFRQSYNSMIKRIQLRFKPS